MPALTGRVVCNLTVSHAERSGRWYGELLGVQEQGRYVQPDGHVGEVCLIEPTTGLKLCLVDHTANPGHRFSEFRTGLDHLELLVASRGDLTAWAERLDRLGIRHSGVNGPRTP